jgi:hypothetical protein
MEIRRGSSSTPAAAAALQKMATVAKQEWLDLVPLQAKVVPTSQVVQVEIPIDQTTRRRLVALVVAAIQMLVVAVVARVITAAVVAVQEAVVEAVQVTLTLRM